MHNLVFSWKEVLGTLTFPGDFDAFFGGDVLRILHLYFEFGRKPFFAWNGFGN